MTVSGIAAPGATARQAFEEAVCCAMDPERAKALLAELVTHLETAVPEYDAEMRDIGDGCGIRRAAWLTDFVAGE